MQRQRCLLYLLNLDVEAISIVHIGAVRIDTNLKHK